MVYEIAIYFKPLVPEVQVVFHSGFSELHAQGFILFQCLLSQQRLQHDIQILSNVFEQHLNTRHSLTLQGGATRMFATEC
jgi:hypothetical protein